MNAQKVLKAIAAAAFGFAAAGTASAEVSELKMMSQYGIGYMQLTLMKQEKLVEKHLAREGLPGTTVTWARMAAGAAANDALLSGSLHFAAGGTGPAIILWDRTRGNIGVHGVAALSSMPNLLVTRDQRIKTIRDFTDKDRIAMAGAGSSVQTTYLQMAVAKEFGIENFKKLNPLMVNLPHPEGLRTMLSGSGEIQSTFTSPPFQNQALENPGVRVVLNSYDVMGGPNTFLMVWATKKFRDENPKTYSAFLAALNEAITKINADKPKYAKVFVEFTKSKLAPEFILEMMNDPQIRFTMAPEGTMRFAAFLHKIGTIKELPGSWKDMFFPEIHNLPGN